MAKTYTFNATACDGGYRGTIGSGWAGYSAQGRTNPRLGQSGSNYYAVYYMFGTATDGSTTYASLQSKTVTSATLTIPVTSLGNGMPGGSSDQLPIRAKATSGTSDWESTGGNIGFVRGTVTNNQVTVSVGTSIPTYGYTMGPAISGVTFIEVGKSAVLTVTTNEVDSFTITYRPGTNGTGSVVTDTKTNGVALTLRGAIYTRTGYTQTGWATSDGGSKAYNLSASYTTNAAATFYPYWTINTYTVSYNANGGSGAPSAQTKTYNVTLTLSSTSPTRTGYTFKGWSTSNTATTATYSAGGSYTANASATLYAVWQVVTYTVSYNKGSNGTGTNTSATKTYNVALTLKGAIFTRSGYTQTGWATSDGGAQAYALSASYTANAAVTLYPVWTAGKSTISTPNGTLGTAQTITITRYNSSYTHTLTYKYGSATGTIVTKTSSTTPSWTPATSLASQFPSATSGTCTITCETFNGNTSLGTTTTTCTLSIPSSIKATISSVSLSETVSGIASQFGGFVQNKSKAKVTVNTSTANAGGATVRSYSITINGQTLASNNATTSLLATSGSNSYTARITDTRGRTSESTGTFTVFAYNAPSVSETAQRNASTTTTINVSYSWTISAVNNHNTKTVKIKYRTFGSSSAATTATTITPSAYSGNGSYAITGLDADTAYDVWVEVTDYFGTVSATSTVAGNANRIYHISHTDKTVARHGANPADGWDHQFFNEQFHGVLDITPRRCYAQLSSAGWYKVCTLKFGSIYSVRGGIGFLIDLCTTTSYNSSTNDTHFVSLLAAYERYYFADEKSVSRSVCIDKIRYVYDGNGNGHIDIHYSQSVQNLVAVDFVAHVRQPSQQYIVAESLQSVADSPSGETVLTEYTFAAIVPETGNKIQRCPDGTLILHGSAINTANGFVAVPFAIPFATDDFTFIASPRYEAAHPSASFRVVTQKTSSLSSGIINFLQLGSTSNYTGTDAVADWIAIGRWK